MKKFFQGIFLTCFIIAVSSLGCAARKEAKNFLPLSPGNTWSYNVDIQGESVQMQVEVGEPKDVEGNNAFPLSYSYNQLALPTQVEYFVIEEDAILFPRIDNVQGQYLKKPFQTFLKFPLKKGEKWEWSGKLVPVGVKTGEIDGKVTVLVKNIEGISVPAGTYEKAVRVSFTSTFETEGTSFKILEDRWYVKGTGMVKEVLYDDQGKQVLVAVLKEFKKKS